MSESFLQNQQETMPEASKLGTKYYRSMRFRGDRLFQHMDICDNFFLICGDEIIFASILSWINKAMPMNYGKINIPEETGKYNVVQKF